MSEIIGSLELEFLINNPELLTQLKQTEDNFQTTTSAIEAQVEKASVATQQSGMRAIEVLKIEQAQFQQLANLQTNPQILADFNRKVQDTGIEIQRLSNIGKTGFDEFGNKIKAATTASNGFLTTLKTIAVYSGIAFLIGKIAQFTSAVIDLTVKTEGVQSAFDKINSPNLLSNLRTATKGTVSDLLLMQKAVLASSEGFPVDKLATFYQFALLKSRELGKSTDDVLNQLIDGTLKNSTRVFTSLGISKAELQDSFKKTGDFTGSVLQLIQDQLKKTAAEADNTADRLGKISATISDIEANVGKSTTGIIGFITNLVQKQLDLINEGIQDMDDKLANLGKKFAVQNNSKLISEFTNDTPEGRASAIKGYQALIEKQTTSVAAYDQKIVDVQNNLSLLQRIGRAAFTDLNDKLENDRDSQVVLLNEYKGELASLNGVIDSENQKKEQQRLKDDASAKARAAALKSARDAAESLYTSQLSVQEQIDSLKDKYASKDRTRDQQAQDAIMADFKKRSEAIDAQNAKYNNYLRLHHQSGIDAFNADPVNKNRQLIRLNPLTKVDEDSAIAGLKGTQSVEQTKIEIEQQKVIFKQYEDFKLKAGTDAANTLYGNELKGYTSYLDYLKSLQPTEADLNSADPYIKAKASALSDYLKKALPEAQKQEYEQQAKHLQDLIIQNESYQQKRATIIAKSNEDIAALTKAGFTEQAAQVAQNTADELTALDVKAFEMFGKYKELFTKLETLSSNYAQNQIKAATVSAAAALATGQITLEAYDKIINDLKKLDQSVKDRLATDILTVSAALTTLGNSIDTTNGSLGSLLTGLGSIGTSIGNITKLSDAFKDATTDEDKFKAGANLVEAGIQGIIQVVDVLSSAAKQRKDAETAYYDAVIASQTQYNIALDDQIRLQEQLNQNIFFKDYKADLYDASLSLSKVNKQLADSFIALQQGAAKTGTHNVVDWKSVGSAAAGGAATGAVIGSVIPVIGSVIGAVVGGVVGAIAGLFGGKKAVDTLSPLLKEFPELIQKDKDGVDQFNEALAKNLIQNNLVTDSTKTLLQNTIALNDERQAAIDQINSDIKDLAGSLGDDLRNSLVKAFEDGTDAAKAFGDSVSKVIENIISQFLFAAIFGDELKKLEANLKASFSITGDQNATDDLTAFFKDAGPLVKAFQDALAAAKAAGAANGLNLFGSTTASSSNTLSGAIKGITADQADILAGSIHGMQLAVLQSNSILKDGNNTMHAQLGEMQKQTYVQIQIEANTRRSADTLDNKVSPALDKIAKNTSDSSGAALRAAGFYGY